MAGSRTFSTPSRSESISITYSMALLTELFPEVYYPEKSEEPTG
jgi:hypothetical protein